MINLMNLIINFCSTGCEGYCGIAEQCQRNSSLEEDDPIKVGCKANGEKRKKRSVSGYELHNVKLKDYISHQIISLLMLMIFISF